MVRLYLGDCLEIMKQIPDGSIDMILCDLPYGTTANKWDVPIDLDQLWNAYRRVVKKGGAIVLFSQQPFSTDLIAANRKQFRYEWIWEKPNSVGYLNANRMPLRVHENILVFYDKLPIYNPQKTKGKPYGYKKRNHNTQNYGPVKLWETENADGMRYPRDVIEFAYDKERYHPTQKPVTLLEYLICTYTNEGNTVLDNCMGSGSTGVACVRTARNFVGIEFDEAYYLTAKQRIESEGKNKLL